MLFLSHHCWKNVGERIAEKQTVNDCQIRSWNKDNEYSWHLFSSTSRVWWLYATGTIKMYIQNTLTRATLGFLEHGLLLLHCSSTFLHPLRKLLQVPPFLSAISWFTHALTLHLGLCFFPASRKVFGSSFQAQQLDTLLKIQWSLRGHCQQLHSRTKMLSFYLYPSRCYSWEQE